ncbi:MAG: 4'-phosphopantetheinyl transferase superfamily protein [Clostridia bacterium]|nr:4'-phosphopantetheinyl transferase superfamily protein [Clostridia bacterium]
MGGIAVYRAEVSALSDPALFEAGMERVPESRREKVTRYRFEEGRMQSLGAGLLLSAALRERGIDGRLARVAEGPWGKPYLPEHPEIHFSISHAGKWALCAVGDRPMGCDVERIGRGMEKMAERYFHPEELAYLKAFGGEEDAPWQRAFTRIWTRKESYVKMTGRGIGEAIGGFSVMADPPGRRYDEGPGEDGEYCFCVCGEWEEKAPPEWRDVGMEELIL